MIEEEGVTATYDATLDALLIEIGGPKEALTEYLVDNIMVRIEPDSLRVVGFEILDFMEDFLPANRLGRTAMGNWVPSRESDSTITLVTGLLAPIMAVAEAAIADWEQHRGAGSP